MFVRTRKSSSWNVICSTATREAFPAPCIALWARSSPFLPSRFTTLVSFRNFLGVGNRRFLRHRSRQTLMQIFETRNIKYNNTFKTRGFWFSKIKKFCSGEKRKIQFFSSFHSNWGVVSGRQQLNYFSKKVRNFFCF